MWSAWAGNGEGGTPDGPMLHSIIIDPRDPKHMYVGLSSGGVFESRDQGAIWAPLNAGCAADFLPDPNPEFGHDPHCVRVHPAAPDVLYQQNHCGIYRMQRDTPEPRWAAHRFEHAQEGRRHRLSDGVASARSQDGVGVSDGRHQRLAAHQPRRQARRVRDAQRRQVVAASGYGPCRSATRG